MSTGVDYSPDTHNEVRWWEDGQDPKDSDNTEQNTPWSPPKIVDLLHNVHINRTTHIKSPFNQRRYPYEFKTNDYFKYKSDPHFKPQEPKKVAFNKTPTEMPVPKNDRITVHLKSVKPANVTYKTLFEEKSLRQRIYDGEVFFYDDYLEYNIAKDYCRLFKRPFNIPRKDWGGENFHFGQKVPDKKLDKEHIELFKRETIKIIKNDDTNKLSETDQLIMSSNDLDDFKKKELLKGEIPKFFETGSFTLKNKAPKDKWVSFHNLKSHALMIDSATKCPLLHVQLQSALQLGWNSRIDRGSFLASLATNLKETKDLYSVSEEQMEKIKQVLSEKKKPVEDPLPDITKLYKSKSYGINENCYTIGGGRYKI